MTDKDEWAEIGHVSASKYRRKIIKQLAADGPQTPSQLSDEIGEGMPHVSRALSELRERELVELLVPEETQKGRYYGVTDLGRSIGERVDEVNA